MREFASALAACVPTLGWSPVMSWTGTWEGWEREETIEDPFQRVRYFPLQRGYSRFPISSFIPFGPKLVGKLKKQSTNENSTVLVCTTPYYAPIAEKWKGPVVYYQTDLTIAYAGVNPSLVRSLDTRLCRVATLVCPNSARIADYMTSEAGCAGSKIVVLPNATRESNVSEQKPTGLGQLPSDLTDLERPIIGVLGNLAANLDWNLILGAVEKTPQFSWAFVGPTTMDVPDMAQREARAKLMDWGGRIRFTGSKPYGLLQQYARAIDVAVLPYRRKEPTYSGSSTRFYEHLAACRPMVATRGFEELLHKEPLLRLVDTPAELVAELNKLAETGFCDGWEEARWRASRQGTWQARAAAMVSALEERLPHGTLTRPN